MRMPIANKTINLIVLNFCFALFCAVLPAFAQIEKKPDESALTVSQLVRDSYANQLRANWRMNFEYTYKRQASLTDRKGKTETWLYETFYPERYRRRGNTQSVSVLLEKDGVPLAAEKIDRLRREAAEKLGSAANQSAEKSVSLEEARKQGMPFDWTWHDASIGAHVFLRRCQFDSPQRELIDGRETVSLNFSNCNAANLGDSFAYLANVQGKIRFDLTDRMPIRLEAYSKTSSPGGLNAAPPKAVITIEQTKVAEGLWLLSSITVNAIGQKLIFPKTQVNWQMKFFDYKLGVTEIEDIKINPK